MTDDRVSCILYIDYIVVFLICDTTHMAEASIKARPKCAIINVDITVCPSPPQCAFTHVTIDHILVETEAEQLTWAQEIVERNTIHELQD